jgi:signal transduction histidine kinase
MIILTGLFFLILLTIFYLTNKKQEDLLHRSSQAQYNNEVNSLLILKTATIKQVVFDYTFWNEFVANIYKNDTVWFENNISTVLKSFHFDYICVFDTNFNLVHEASEGGIVTPGFISSEILKEVRKTKFIHFFQNTDNGLIEISGATIHPDNDPSHTLTKPSGYLFIVKSWNRNFLEQLMELSVSKIEIYFHSDSIPNNDPNAIAAVKRLPGWNDECAAQIVFTRTLTSFQLYHKMSVVIMLVMLGSVLGTWFVFHMMTRKLINEPLKLVTHILKTGSLKHISELQQCKGEFRDIGMLFSNFINQKDQLRLAKENADEAHNRYITERLQADKEILELNENLDHLVKQRTAELETANRELETFSFSVSHDLKTPLRHITGYIGLFTESKSAELTEDESGYLKKITIAATQMSQLIDALLTFSRLNLTQLRKTKISSNDMVLQVLNFFEPDLTNRKISFNIAPLPDIKGDEDMIRQVWTNLISNAIKYTGKKPEAIIEIGSETNNGETTFFVKDNGAGFNMKYAEKLFNVFQRLHKPRDFEGIGIGLANVNRIVKRHGGQCRAEGEPDKGAVFYFSLPE